eukprot:TRINITY_DN8699_c0_g2_i3.p1 TRINITY_DN8699_c0_g2~~TRINITY_DN8699_c0_g2_i3.p1  ORF type:complete len:485 (+),score=134.76 TRINITY_DN8699_c0_g2_i3:536-1990(+)
MEKDFKCDKHTLLSQMKYFEKFQPVNSSGSTALEDLDISVHCDIQIFEWLMKYLQHPQMQTKSLEVANVISILISAEYLQMPRLVESCIEFVKSNLGEVLKLPIDTNCIAPNILKKLASMIRVEELDELKDRKDKLLSKLYMKKLELLLEDETHSLLRCVYCNKLFTNAQKSWRVCSKANIFIDFHGSVIAEHVSDRLWDVNKFIHYLRQQCSLSWKEIYYKIWAHLVTLHCGECDQDFVGSEIGHCVYHAQKPRFGGSNYGTYQCCGAPAIRFDTALRNDGCTAKNHRLAGSWKSAENEHLFNELLKRHNIVAEPFISEYQYAEKYKVLEAQTLNGRLSQQNGKAVDSLPLSKIKDSPPLVVLIRRYVANVGESNYCASEDEDEDEVVEAKESAGCQKKGRKDRGSEAIFSPQKMKSWRIDALRGDDRAQMQNIIRKLKKFRGDAPAPIRRSNIAANNATKSTLGNKALPPKPVVRKQSKYSH